MTRVLALDQATTTGIAVIEDGKLIFHDKQTVEGEWEDKVNQIKKLMIDMISDHSPDIVAIENIQFQQNQDVYRKLAELKGVLENHLFDSEIDYRIVSPSTWKSICGIKKQGRDSEKKQAQGFVEKIFDVKLSQDASDATCIAYSVWVKNK